MDSSKILKSTGYLKPRMPRAKWAGWICAFLSVILGGFYIFFCFVADPEYGFASNDTIHITHEAYISMTAPIVLVSAFILGTGFWIGWTILTIKVVPPMPELVEKKDTSKPKAVLLCLGTLALALLLGYGIYVRSYWAIAIPSALIAFVVLGALFWVGIAIITTRTTLPEREKEQNGA